MPKTFRELFEMLQEPAAPASVVDETIAPTVSPTLSPPPAPVEPSRHEEAGRILYGPGKTKRASPPLQVERIRGKTSSNLHRILKNRGTLREALILKEILDVPAALRE